MGRETPRGMTVSHDVSARTMASSSHYTCTDMMAASRPSGRHQSRHPHMDTTSRTACRRRGKTVIQPEDSDLDTPGTARFPTADTRTTRGETPQPTVRLAPSTHTLKLRNHTADGTRQRRPAFPSDPHDTMLRLQRTTGLPPRKASSLHALHDPCRTHQACARQRTCTGHPHRHATRADDAPKPHAGSHARPRLRHRQARQTRPLSRRRRPA